MWKPFDPAKLNSHKKSLYLRRGDHHHHHHIYSSRTVKRSVKGSVIAWNVTTLCLAFFVSCLVLIVVEWEAPDLMPQSFIEVVEDSLQFIRKEGPCDYSKGAWVRSRRAPLYSGKECRRWLSPMWACRLNGNRTNFRYESLRWQPHGRCRLPVPNPNTFLQRMRNKTIAFIGDSLGRQQFQSLMCILTHGRDENENVLEVGIEYGFPSFPKFYKPNNSKSSRPSNWAYRFQETNTTILFSWSTTLCHLQPLTMDQIIPSNHVVPLINQTSLSNHHSLNGQDVDVALHVDLPPLFLASNLHKFDVVILNTGPHWNPNKFSKNRWKLHMQGKPLDINIDMQVVTKYYNYTVHRLIGWLNAQLEIGATKATIFYRTSSPRHFFHGEWDSGGRCDNTHFRFINSINKRNLYKGPFTDLVGDSAVHGTSIKLLNITWLSHLRDEAHISKYTLKAKNGSQDCLHWCLPGVPDTWNEIFFVELLQHRSYQEPR